MALAEPEPASRTHRMDELATGVAAVAEEARRHLVHLTTTGGGDFVLLAREHYDEISRWVGAVLVADSALRTTGKDGRRDDFGDVAWLAAFDDEDLATFVDSMRDAVLASLRSGIFDELRALGRRWETTATVLADPLSREVLLGPHNPDDFIEVSRPA